MSVSQGREQYGDNDEAENDGRPMRPARLLQEVGRNPFDDDQAIVDWAIAGGSIGNGPTTGVFSMVRGSSGERGPINSASSSRELLLRAGVFRLDRDYPVGSGKTEIEGSKTGPDWGLSRDAVESVIDSLRHISLFKPQADIYVQFTIPFDRTGVDEGLKLEGSQGLESFTGKQCSDNEGIKTISKRLGLNRPPRQATEKVSPILLRLKFRLREPWRVDECREATFECFDILFASGIQFKWEDNMGVKLAYKNDYDVDQLFQEVSKVRHKLLGVGNARKGYREEAEAKATSGRNRGT